MASVPKSQYDDLQKRHENMRKNREREQRRASKLEAENARLRILIDTTRGMEREACAKLCDELQKNHDRYYRLYRADGDAGKPYDPAHCAVAIRARPNV